MTTKPTWIVCGMDGFPLTNPRTDRAYEFTKHGPAIKLAKEHVRTSQDDEAWVYRLSHIVSRPTGELDVEVVK